MFAFSKVTLKGQTIIPKPIRIALNVVPSDLITWETLSDGSASVRRLQALEIEYLRSLEESLCEWSSAIDEKAYRDL